MADNNDILNQRGAELLKVRQERLENRSVAEVKLLEKIKNDQAEVDRLIKNVSVDFEKSQAEIVRLSHRMEEAKKLLQSTAQGRVYGAEKSFQQSIRTQMSSSQTLSDIAAASRQSSILGGAISVAQSRSTSEIEDSIARNKAELSRRSDIVRETAINVRGNESTLAGQMVDRQKIIQQIAQDQAALSAQRKMGIDISSQYYGAQSVTEKAISAQEQSDIRRGVAAGQFGDRKQVEQQLEETTKKLIATFNQFDAAVKAGTKDADGLGKKFAEIQKDYERQQSILKEMGGPGGGGPTTGQIVGGMFGSVGTMAQGAAQVYRHAGITSEFAQMQNRIGFAGLANQRFDDIYGATQGNMTSFRRLAQDSYSAQVARAHLMGGREDIAKLIETGALGAKAVGAGINAASGPEGMIAAAKGFMTGGPKGAALGAILAGGAEATPHAVGAINSAIDYGKYNTQGATALQGAAQMRQMQDALNKIGDFTSQTTADYSRNLTLSTRGLGGMRGRMQSELLDTGTVSSLAGAGINLNDIPGLVSAGRGALGSQFRVSDIARGGSLAQTGYLDSPEQYLAARGALSSSGGGAKELEDIMKNAVANGMDSSKNIMEMVQATSSLSRGSAGAGISTVGGSAGLLGKGIDALRATGVSENMAVGAAANAARAAEEVGTSRGLDIFNVVETARIRKRFGTASLQQMQSMQTASPQELAQLRNLFKSGKTKEAQEMSIKMGMFGQLNTAEDVEALQDIQREQVAGRALGFGTDIGMEKSIQAKIRKGEKLTPAERSHMAGMTRLNLGRDVSGDALFGAMSPGEASGLPLATNVPAGEGQITAGAMGNAKVFADGVENFNKAIGGLDKLGDTMIKVAEVFKPEEFTKATKEAADNFKVPTKAFGDSVTKFETAVGALVEAVKGLSSGDKNAVNKLMNNINPNQTR